MGIIKLAAMYQRTHYRPFMSTFVAYLVEDNPIILANLIETFREMADLKITSHSSTQTEANHWLTLNAASWHLAIVDLFLREGSGLGILAACRDRQAYQKMVVLTNYATADVRERAAALGADAVFDKSTELDALIAYCRQQTGIINQTEVEQAQCHALKNGQLLAEG